MTRMSSDENKEVPPKRGDACDAASEEREQGYFFTRHLDELRCALIRILIGFGLCFLLAYSFSDFIVKWLEAPLLQCLPGGSLYFTGVADKFFAHIKASSIAGLVLVMPYALYELWGFVAPGLYERERRLAAPLVVGGTVAFIAGILFAYYGVLPYGYRFLLGFAGSTDKPLITLREYLNLTFQLLLVFGLIFELPVVVMALGLLGLIRSQTLARYRRHAILLIAIFSAIVTPSVDAFTMVLAMVPLWLLYEASIVGLRLAESQSGEKVKGSAG